MTFVISECAINFRSEKEAVEMIKASADAGADAVKFQYYSPEQVDYHPRKDELICRSLTPSRVKFLSHMCQQYDIEFMATPMSVEAVKILSPYVKRWKIRFKDCNNSDIFNAIDQERFRHILVSCQNQNATLFHVMGRKVIPLWVVPEYPPKEVLLPDDFTYYQGFSSHYPNIEVPLEAVKRGAKYLEIHTMLDNYSDNYIPIDRDVSVTMSELGELVKTIRRLEK